MGKVDIAVVAEEWLQMLVRFAEEMGADLYFGILYSLTRLIHKERISLTQSSRP